MNSERLSSQKWNEGLSCSCPPPGVVEAAALTGPVLLDPKPPLLLPKEKVDDEDDVDDVEKDELPSPK